MSDTITLACGGTEVVDPMGREEDREADAAAEPLDRSGTPGSLVERVRALTTGLEAIAGDWSILDQLPAADRERLHRAVAAVYDPDPHARRLRLKVRERDRRASGIRRDDAVLHETGIRALRRRRVFTTPNVFPPASFQPDEPADSPDAAGPHEHAGEVGPRHCYVCKRHYTAVHHFYDQLCPTCAAFNYDKRTELADLRGRVALITGGRVKIGYQASLKLLRCGADVLVTTRFPRNAAARYAAEPDFDDWSGRLEIVGLDLRHTPSVETFCRRVIATRSRLDFIVNNACQTVRRPPAFYAHMLDEERAAWSGLSPSVRRLLLREDDARAAALARTGGGERSNARAAFDPSRAAELSQVALLAEDQPLPGVRDLFPDGPLDSDLQQLDLRSRNSWRLLLEDVSAVELLEVQLVNAVAPFVINARLKPLMVRTPERDKHIVNVSAVEGQFYRRFKTTRHPHTNMAKAALNMMTRTAAADFHASGIHMNSVDTGWVTDEDPEPIAARKTAEQRFHPPLDVVDGAARIVDPIIDGFNTGRHVWGQFLKDYKPTDW